MLWLTWLNDHKIRPRFQQWLFFYCLDRNAPGDSLGNRVWRLRSSLTSNGRGWRAAPLSQALVTENDSFSMTLNLYSTLNTIRAWNRLWATEPSTAAMDTWLRSSLCDPLLRWCHSIVGKVREHRMIRELASDVWFPATGIHSHR